MKRVCLYIIALLFFNEFTSAQKLNAFISFKETLHDFGKIREDKGPVNCVFEFVNTGSNIVLIQDVQTSCGCTTPEYSKAPVKPGEKGYVKTVFDPNGRPGQFLKEITILSNAENSPVVLKITGTVIAREPRVEDIYRYAMGDIRLESSHVGFNKVSPGTLKTDTILFINTGKDAVKIDFQQIPAFLKIKVEPVIIKANKKGNIIISYDAKIKNDWGFVVDYLYLTLNGVQDPKNKLTITADIGEDFSKYTVEQKANAPKIVFDNANYNFETVKAGSVVEHEFTFTNQGKSDLLIRKITSSCGCTATKPKDMVIKPGASSSVTAKFNTTGYRNMQTKTITVITNDPVSPALTLWIKGKVE